jgi:hypothetical protein
LTKAMTKLGPCQVRSGTELPCPRPAVVRIRGVPFCKPCAREQEAYFAIGELTEIPESPNNQLLVELLDRTQRTSRYRRVRVSEPDAA